MIRIIKFFAKGLVAFLLLLLLYFIAALIGSAIPVNSNWQSGGEITVYLRSNGTHTDFIFPVKSDIIDWEQLIDSTHTLSKIGNYDYISFGWGDLEFYQKTPDWDDLTFPTAVRAVFLPTPSAMHVEFESAPRLLQPTVPIRVSREEYKTLVEYVKWSFQRDFSGKVKPVPDLHYNRNDAFFHAKRSLNSFYTCNTWVNNGLKKAGLPACLWTPFDDGIFYKYH
ncbi:TIGR02117 family protein [Salinimicrobium sp. CDJ15-81-2]|nr:TIGR02117 family protein [Salinimicrobium nanhaiense]